MAESDISRNVPVIRAGFPRTIRLVTSARLRAAVLADLAAENDLAALAEIEGATSQRLMAEDGSSCGVGRDELVHHIPFASFINASFAYFKPGEPNRFNSDRGAWYCALEVETCLAEVAWHMSEFLGRTGRYHAIVDYAQLYASLAGEFYDLPQKPDHPALLPVPNEGYPEGNRLAADALSRGLNGIIYPSVRRPEGTCLAILLAHAVQSVAQGGVHRLTWSGSPEPSIVELS